MFLNLFPVWVICAALAGLLFPEQISTIKDWIVLLLSGVMLCMGLTLRFREFVDIAQYKLSLWGSVQYTTIKDTISLAPADQYPRLRHNLEMVAH